MRFYAASDRINAHAAECMWPLVDPPPTFRRGCAEFSIKRGGRHVNPSVEQRFSWRRQVYSPLVLHISTALWAACPRTYHRRSPAIRWHFSIGAGYTSARFYVFAVRLFAGVTGKGRGEFCNNPFPRGFLLRTVVPSPTPQHHDTARGACVGSTIPFHPFYAHAPRAPD